MEEWEEIFAYAKMHFPVFPIETAAAVSMDILPYATFCSLVRSTISMM